MVFLFLGQEAIIEVYMDPLGFYMFWFTASLDLSNILSLLFS